MIEPTVYELSSPGRHGPLLPALDVPLAPLPDLASCARPTACRCQS
jgi:hypothetical protein